ncbi:flavonol synthase [Croceibacterium mercuriale]|uniref:2-oxoglutarate-dependent ethylene/succinate-forming enzyme n=1 Tax=Croceibacterium mercuriale TaxID=1572751 RepID=A0A0B2C2R7_9SPHN|nr:2-oxoglutarate and iron-dependent oxygenase domain-containing protein [Croceibacterium mercuriale]KHL26256.1 flavonol synthase [Croceibacterium mercuriale]
MTAIATTSLTRQPAELAADLGQSFEQYGFAIVADHGIPTDLIARAQEQARALFALPEEQKRQWHQTGQGGARGYTPFGIEQAKGATVRDLKEFWHVGRELPAGDPLAVFMAPNIWPDDVLPDFRPTFLELYARFEQVGAHILSAIALHLGLEERWFDPTVEQGNSVLRLLHYPPVPPEAEGAVRAAPHEDINTITLLLGAEEAGLELLARSGEWLAVAPPPGALVVNIGDMLQRLTAGRLPSTTHRVINPTGPAAARPRYSMPFFLHFRPDFLIDPIVPGGEAPITADDYLKQRLREIKLA